MKYYKPYTYKAKLKKSGAWIEDGFIYEDTPLYCFNQDYESIERNFWFLKPGFADWGLTRPMEKYKIIPETISRFIGYLDSNKNKIYENDIVCFGNTNGHIFHRELIWFNNELQAMTAVPLDEIEYNGLDYYNNKYNKFNYETFCLMLQDPWGDYSKIEVIGNIFDNYNLIEEELKNTNLNINNFIKIKEINK